MSAPVETLFALRKGNPIDEERIDVFQGQGSQRSAMGKTIYEVSSHARAVYEAANDILGYSLSDLCRFGSKEELEEPEILPVATMTTNLATLAAARERNPSLRHTNPKFVAGHSLGEYTSAVVNNVIQFSDALKIVALRGKLMYEAGKKQNGGMAVVLGLEKDEVQQYCNSIQIYARQNESDLNQERILEVANINTPIQVVVSGDGTLLDQLRAVIRNGRVKRLPIPVASHSSLMKPVVPPLEKKLSQMDVQEPVVPVLSNANIFSTAEQIIRNLGSNVVRPVDWVGNINAAVANGINQVNEYGTGVLNGLVEQINARLRRNNF